MSDLEAPGGTPVLAYLAVADDIERRIVSGELKPGTRLRPERELADYYECSYTTVRRAMRELREVRGLIDTRWGHGTFVRQDPPAPGPPPPVGGHAIGGHAVLNVVLKAGVTLGVWHHAPNWRLTDWILLAVFIVAGVLITWRVTARRASSAAEADRVKVR